jgi:gamma-carbonic anhydrase
MKESGINLMNHPKEKSEKTGHKVLLSLFSLFRGIHSLLTPVGGHLKTVSYSKMGPPTIFMRFRETLGRALRETGQWLDRVGIQGHQMAVTKRVLGDDPLIFEDHLSRHRHQMPLLKRGRPVIDPNVAFLAPCSTLIGSVKIGAGSSVFYKAILRADNCENADAFKNENELLEWNLEKDRGRKESTRSVGGGIFIGENTNVQDGCIIDSSKNHTKIGNGVTIGHLAHIHSATVHDYCLIGMGALLQEGVVVNEESFIAAGAVIAKDTVVGPGELWVGNPARKLRDLSPEERQRLHYQSSEVSRFLFMLDYYYYLAMP